MKFTEEMQEQFSKEIFDEFEQHCGWEDDGSEPCLYHQKECALIAANKIKQVIGNISSDKEGYDYMNNPEFWEQVILKIEKLQS